MFKNIDKKNKIKLQIMVGLAVISFLGLPIMFINENVGINIFTLGFIAFAFFALFSILIQTKFNYFQFAEKNFEKADKFQNDKKYFKMFIYGLVSPAMLLGIIFVIVYTIVMLVYLY